MNKKSPVACIVSVMFLGMLTKIISMASRIIMSRELGVEAVAIYSLVNPLFVFAITIATFSLPTVIATLVSRHPERAKKIFLTSLLIGIFFNVIFILIIVFAGKFIAIYLLHNVKTYPSIRLLALVVPLTTLSSIIKGYFMGKKELVLTSTSSLIEECSRLLSTLALAGFFVHLDSEIKATFFILVMIIGEIFQTTYLLLSSGRQYLKNIAKIQGIFYRENHVFPEVVSLSFPLTLSRLVTSFTFMIEPMILTAVLLSQGYSSEEITLNYGVLSSYVMPLLLFPGFFSLSIANYLLPNLSSLIAQNKYKEGRTLFNRLLLMTFFIGVVFSVAFFFWGDRMIALVYHVNYGKEEIKKLAIPFLIYYVETPVNIAMHALNQSKVAFKSSLLSSFVRISLLVVLSKYFGVFAVALSTLASCYLDVIINYLTVCHIFKRNQV